MKQIDVALDKKEWLELVSRNAKYVFPAGSGARSIWNEWHKEFSEDIETVTKEDLVLALGQATLNLFVESAIKEGIALLEADKLKGNQNDLFGGDQASTDLESKG